MNETNIERVEREANERVEAVAELRRTHRAWYGEILEDWSTEQIKTVTRIMRYATVPLANTSNLVAEYLKEHGEDVEDNDDLVSLFEALESELPNFKVDIEENVDVVIKATVTVNRKPWQDRDRFMENLFEDLRVEITSNGHELEDVSIDDIDER